MELASTLLELVSDATDARCLKLSEVGLIHQLEDVNKQLQQCETSIMSPESIAFGICHVTGQVVGYLVQYRPVLVQKARFDWQKCSYILQTAVSSAFEGIQGHGDEDLALKQDDNNEFCNIYRRLLHRLWKASQSPQQADNVVTVMTKLCVLLSICWLSYDRVGKLMKAEKLLHMCSEFCIEHESLSHQAKWPQFLLAMLYMVEKKDYMEALVCLQNVVERCNGSAVEDGMFFYWQAVALIHNNRTCEAIAALGTCIRANYEPVACLSLQALVNLQAQDYYAGAEQLQRALEIDYTRSRSLFNNALLMERMGNFEAQQQLLEYVLKPHKNVGDQCGNRKRKHTGDAADLPCATTTLFDDVSLRSVFPSRLTSVDTSMAQFHMALAAMENGIWLESKHYFEEFFGATRLSKYSCTLLEAARDYVYVLLQCSLPSLALRNCEQYLLELEDSDTNSTDIVAVVTLLLHLYRADALLCLERVDECYNYLQQTARPRIQAMMQRQSNADPINNSVTGEIASCHLQLLNNLAVATTCCAGVDAGLSVLRDGLEQYPDCLTIKFNFVLLLWRKGDKTTACSIWAKARGWNFQAESSNLNTATVNLNAATSASQFHAPFISEHVQGKRDGVDGISAQQLVYLDALILHHWRQTRNLQLATSLEFVEYLETLSTTSI